MPQKSVTLRIYQCKRCGYKFTTPRVLGPEEKHKNCGGGEFVLVDKFKGKRPSRRMLKIRRNRGFQR